MNILFMDTSTSNINIALIKNHKHFLKQVLGNHDHSKKVIPLLQELLSDTKTKIEELNEIIVVNGPGSFTGIRIGVTIAKTLAYTKKIPIKTLSSIEAFGISEKEKFDIIALQDSKGYYSAEYKNKTFTNFTYHKEENFEDYTKNKIVSFNNKLDLDKILKYCSDIKSTSPHLINPIYIKKIDALK